jgi:ubiquinone/menaquinone biosynthesis C-methylase UbiE
MQSVDHNPDSVKCLVRATFNAAAEHFDDAALFFWDRLGRKTVELAGVAPGHRVLDVCCGSGGSAIPAAERVGTSGCVIGVDLAEKLLELAREKAIRLGLDNARFIVGDMDSLDVADDSVDIVLCVLGLYFARDLPAAVRELWRTLKPGGTLAVTTWGPRALEPMNSIFLQSIVPELPRIGLRPDTVSWARINESATLTKVFRDAEVSMPKVDEEVVEYAMSPEDFWTVVLGSGYRLLVETMGATAAERVRRALMDRVRNEHAEGVTSDVLYARAKKT